MLRRTQHRIIRLRSRVSAIAVIPSFFVSRVVLLCIAGDLPFSRFILPKMIRSSP